MSGSSPLPFLTPKTRVWEDSWLLVFNYGILPVWIRFCEVIHIPLCYVPFHGMENLHP